jgi:hypothetical protein
MKFCTKTRKNDNETDINLMYERGKSAPIEENNSGSWPLIYGDGNQKLCFSYPTIYKGQMSHLKSIPYGLNFLFSTFTHKNS